MNTKLTLSVDQKIIGEIKLYAKQHNTSLSKLVENYFNYIVNHTSSKKETSALVNDLSGIIEIPADFDERDLYNDYLTEKY